MRAAWALLAVLGLAARPAAAAAPVVALSTPAVTALAPGREATAKLTFTVAPGFHIQANPAARKNLIPARLTLEAAEGVAPGDPKYPPSKAHRLQGAREALATYEGEFTILVPVQAKKAAKPGRRVLKGLFRFQACDARRCLFPAQIPVILPVEILQAQKP